METWTNVVRKGGRVRPPRGPGGGGQGGGPRGPVVDKEVVRELEVLLEGGEEFLDHAPNFGPVT